MHRSPSSPLTGRVVPNPRHSNAGTEDVDLDAGERLAPFIAPSAHAGETFIALSARLGVKSRRNDPRDENLRARATETEMPCVIVSAREISDAPAEIPLQITRPGYDFRLAAVRW